MTVLPHLAARLFGVPLAIHRPKLDVILSVLGARVGLPELAAPRDYAPPMRQPTPATGKVAVIPIHGTLVRRMSGLEAASGLASYTGIAAQLDAALASPDVAAILLDVDSPGGESGGVFDLADRIVSALKSASFFSLLTPPHFVPYFFTGRSHGQGRTSVILD